MRPLAPRARKALLTLHISASVALIGSGAGITALALIAIIACGALVIRPLMDHLIDGGERGSAQWAMAAGAASNTACAAVSVGLAVFKPGGRLRRAQPAV